MRAAVRDSRNTRKSWIIVATIMAALALGGCGSAAGHSGSTGNVASAAPTTAAPTTLPTSAAAGSLCVSATTNGLCNYTGYSAIVGASSNPWVGQNIWSGNTSYKQT